MSDRRAIKAAGCVALVGLLIFGALTAVVAVSTSGVWSIDGSTHLWVRQHRPEVAAALARAVTSMGTGLIPYVLVGLAGLVAGRNARDRLLAVAVGLACLGMGQALRYGVMRLVARPRPPVADWATHASGWSFPSGHTVTAAITAGVLIGAVLLRAPRGKRTMAVVIGCWGALVGLTRVYLGVHWLTDVAGGWLFATTWLALCACLIRRLTPVH